MYNSFTKNLLRSYLYGAILVSFTFNMTNMTTPFPVGSLAWLPWRRVWYLTRVEKVRQDEDHSVKLLVHVHGEPLTKDKWVTVLQNGSSATGTPPLRLLQVLPNALPGVGAFPTVGNHVRLLVMDQELIKRINSRRSDDPNDVEIPALVGIVVKVLPARDASLVHVAYPTDLVAQIPDESQWQRVQIGNGYINVISESQFVHFQQQLLLALTNT
ncbi:hypothetical protein P3T76_011858 [Phytophthora citrophthora]|uniref:Uncharacterized protein n=1 Tax=Phytophthora citrophthora TaxID=4793 RepID=A0AAD9G8D3_9STRA|nr:hypothetical protein P3T76_011858 [Phytophthora citrophthora]